MGQIPVWNILFPASLKEVQGLLVHGAALIQAGLSFSEAQHIIENP